MGRSPVSVVIADDQGLFRAGLARLLAEDPGVEVVGLAADGVEAVERCAELGPDVVLMDLKMPRMDGLEATARILQTAPSTKVLVLTTFNHDSEVLAALKAGASGYILKDSPIEAVVGSVVAVKHGEQVLPGAAAPRMAGRNSPGARTELVHDELTPRETEILGLIAEGVTNKQIARRLEISEKTVRNHLSHIYEKLQISDRSQALLYAMRKGMVEV
jgi:DNA-binding NarL/FixJ family response regulator